MTIAGGSVRGELADAVRDLLWVDHEPVLEDVVVGHARDVRTGDARDRAVEVVERLLGDDRAELGAIAEEPIVLVDDQALPGLPDGREHRLLVERAKRPEVDDLDADPLLRDNVRRL